jgi:hypothetical protein
MKRRFVYFIAAAIAAGGAVSACTSTLDGSTIDESRTGEVRKVIFQYDGKPITCLNFNPDQKSESFSCDFVKYYNDQKNVPVQ